MAGVSQLTMNSISSIQHPWNVTPREGCEIQKGLAKKVIVEDRIGQVHYVAGVDVGLKNNNTMMCAAVAVLTFPALELHEYAIAHNPTCFPYVPGLLSFREIPTVLKALEKIKRLPHVILCDGQGVAHPRRLGIASHIGVLTGLPTIGVAKTRLIGTHHPVPEMKGSWVPLIDGDERIGALLRTRTGVKPLYISVGHKVSLPTAIDYVMRCLTRFRLPETTRWAHKLAKDSA